MNVLQVVPELNAGGVERTTLEIVEALTANGHGAHVASLGGRMEPELLALGGTLHPMPVGSKNPLKLRRNTKALIDLIKSEKIDIVHARSRAPAWPAHAAAKATGRPFVTTYHGIYKARSRVKRRYNAVMTRGDMIIANSNFTKAHIINEHLIDAAKIVTIPRGVDIERFDPERIDPTLITALRQDWMRELSPTVKTLVLLPGRLTVWKGQTVAIEALPHLPSDCGLVLLGDPQGRDDYVEDLRTLTKDLNVSDRVTLQAHSQNMPLAFMAADIVVSASTEPEAFGRVAAEAQAMGRPVVASAHGGALETIIQDKTGLLVPPGDAKALAAAVLSLVGNNHLQAEAARARIISDFSKTALQNATLDVYKRILQHHELNTA